jgi:thiol-disulfide isomerase/thioredoxin
MTRSRAVAVLVLAACRPAAPRAVDPPAAEGAMAGNLAASQDGLLLTWIEPAAAGHRLRFARFVDGKWRAPSTITEGTKLIASWADVPSVAAGAGGALVAHFAEAGGDPEAYDVVLARSDDGGATWTRLGVPHRDGTPTEHGFVSLVPDGEGVRAVWLDGRAGHGTTGLRSALAGRAIGEEALLDARVCDCCGTAAAVASDGLVVAYRDRSEDEVRDISVVRRAAGAWSEPRPLAADGWTIAGCPVNGPALAADGRRAVVAWYTYAGERHAVRLAFSSDGGASFGPPVEVDWPHERRQPVGRVDVTVHGDDAIVSWMAAERDEAALYARRVSPDGGLGEPFLVAPMRPERASGFPRMERAGDALAFVWTEIAAGRPSRLRAAFVPASALRPGTLRAPPPPAAARAPVGARLSDYAAVTLDGKPVTVASLAGRPALINVWATWCEPCRQELPELAELARRHPGLAMVGISVDREAGRVRDLAARRGLPFAVWHDPDDRASRALAISALPVNVLVDGNGTVVWRKDGAIDADDPSLAAALRVTR